MATLQASSPYLPSSSSPSFRKIKATLHSQKLPKKAHIALRNVLQTSTIPRHIELNPNHENYSYSKVVQELYAIMEIVADRVEMHKNIGAQRDNWNRLLLNSANGMTVTAATMAGLAALFTGSGAPFLALKLSSTFLYMAATGILFVMSKIQPSQLAEEQRNASRLFKQLHQEIKTTLAIRKPSTDLYVKKAMEKVLALDQAYPLPLLGVMLDKFPTSVEPAVWWPKHLNSHQEKNNIREKRVERNGWNENLEQEMKEIIGVLKRKDDEEYLRLSKIVLKVHKILAICGPLFTGIAAFGSAFLGSPFSGSWAAILGVVFGAMATVVNSLEHGGQVGMVFEMYRSSAGFFRLMEERIESNLKEGEIEKREDGEVFEVEVALKLGRSLSELKDLASASQFSSTHKEAKEEYASKLF